MARILSALPAALIAARNGLSAAEFGRALRAAGLGARESEVRALYRIAQQTVQKSPEEPFADLNTVPDLAGAKPWPTVSAKGVSQRIEVTYRQRSTGTLITVPYSVTSQAGVTRQQAIDQAIEAYRTKAEQYDQELVGAVHTKTYRYTPAVVK